jgi:TolB-like protein
MKNKLFITLTISFVLFLAVFPGGGNAFCEKVKIAMLTVENGGKDPRYDYLEGLLGGLILYDLSSTEGIIIVERSSLEQILKEQELMVSDLAENKAFQIGKILGADFLLRASFIFMGEDVLLNATVMEVATAKSLTISERGRTENLVHLLCEKIIKKLTGKDVALASDLHERSILSLKDEKPGSISIHSPIVDAEIFLDEQFAAFTNGDEKTPVKLENVAPGKHKVRIHLSGFGMFKQPELTLTDWAEEVNVLPGKNVVLRARPRMYSELIYGVQKLADDDIKVALKSGKGDFSRTNDLTFTDRKGGKIQCTLTINGICDAKVMNAKVLLVYEGKEHPFIIACKSGESAELKEKI